MRTERNERSRREYKSPGRQRFRNRNRSRDNSSRVLEILKTEIEGILRELIDLEIILEIDQMIELEMAEMILDNNQAGIVNIVIRMVTLGNIVGRCKPMLRKPEGLRRWMTEMMTHQTPSTPW